MSDSKISKFKNNSAPKLTRQLGILGLTATGICSMLGASIYVVPFMIQRNVPGIGPYVLHAFLFAAIPAIFAAFAYASLATAMPRAGGSYIYASRGLSPYLGFIASFSQWFGLSIVIGVIAYIIVPFIRDIAIAMDFKNLAAWFELGWIRVSLALILLWTFVLVNILGAKFYERTLIPLMFLMFGLSAIVIIVGFYFSQEDFASSVLAKEGKTLSTLGLDAQFSWKTFLSAAALLFASFIGFDSIAQAGGEARNPSKTLPWAIALAIISVGSFYILFTAAVYHAVPWTYVAEMAMIKDITAPGLLSTVLSTGLGIAIVAGAAIALINDLPAMLLSVSRLMFAWAEDHIFPKAVAKVHPSYHTPHIALLLSGVVASIGILGSHFAGDFFLGIDIMVTSMMVNFLLMCITLITIDKINAPIAENITILKNKKFRKGMGGTGTVILFLFLTIHTWKDLHAEVDVWYFRSTPIWLIVMTLASFVYFWKIRDLKSRGIQIRKIFRTLPPE